MQSHSHDSIASMVDFQISSPTCISSLTDKYLENAIEIRQISDPNHPLESLKATFKGHWQGPTTSLQGLKEQRSMVEMKLDNALNELPLLRRKLAELSMAVTASEAKGKAKEGFTNLLGELRPTLEMTKTLPESPTTAYALNPIEGAFLSNFVVLLQTLAKIEKKINATVDPLIDEVKTHLLGLQTNGNCKPTMAQTNHALTSGLAHRAALDLERVCEINAVEELECWLAHKITDPSVLHLLSCPTPIEDWSEYTNEGTILRDHLVEAMEKTLKKIQATVDRLSFLQTLFGELNDTERYTTKIVSVMNGRCGEAMGQIQQFLDELTMKYNEFVVNCGARRRQLAIDRKDITTQITNRSDEIAKLELLLREKREIQQKDEDALFHVMAEDARIELFEKEGKKAFDNKSNNGQKLRVDYQNEMFELGRCEEIAKKLSNASFQNLRRKHEETESFHVTNCRKMAFQYHRTAEYMFEMVLPMRSLHENLVKSYKEKSLKVQRGFCGQNPKAIASILFPSSHATVGEVVVLPDLVNNGKLAKLQNDQQVEEEKLKQWMHRWVQMRNLVEKANIDPTILRSSECDPYELCLDEGKKVSIAANVDHLRDLVDSTYSTLEAFILASKDKSQTIIPKVFAELCATMVQLDEKIKAMSQVPARITEVAIYLRKEGFRQGQLARAKHGFQLLLSKAGPAAKAQLSQDLEWLQNDRRASPSDSPHDGILPPSADHSCCNLLGLWSKIFEGLNQFILPPSSERMSVSSQKANNGQTSLQETEENDFDDLASNGSCSSYEYVE